MMNEFERKLMDYLQQSQKASDERVNKLMTYLEGVEKRLELLENAFGTLEKAYKSLPEQFRALGSQYNKVIGLLSSTSSAPGSRSRS